MNSVVIIVAIIAIASMQMFAMANGHDGIVLVSCVAVISGLAGYKVPGLLSRIKDNSKK